MSLAGWKRVGWVMTALVVAAAVGYLFVPAPVEVDAVEVTRGPLRVTVDQEGRTRVRERYVVSAPLGGMLRRIGLKAGDEVEAGVTLLAEIEPTPASLLDERARQEAEARVRAAEAALAQAEPAIVRAEAELQQAKLEYDRARRLVERQAMSREEAETRALMVAIRQAEVRSATFARDVAQHQVELARAALAQARSSSSGESPVFPIVSPVSGRVLRVIQESEAPVTPGTALLEVGDVNDLEVVVDVLSRDAVNIRPGAAVVLERWGGSAPLKGTVRRVEPSAFTKISALGVEEQRVNVIVDLLRENNEEHQALGDGYRVDARIVVWERPDVLKVPTGALFRAGDDWAVYAIRDGRAVLQRLKLGRMNDLEAEVLEGLRDGDRVVQHPSDKVADGLAVAIRGERR